MNLNRTSQNTGTCGKCTRLCLVREPSLRFNQTSEIPHYQVQREDLFLCGTSSHAEVLTEVGRRDQKRCSLNSPCYKKEKKNTSLHTHTHTHIFKYLLVPDQPSLCCCFPVVHVCQQSPKYTHTHTHSHTHPHHKHRGTWEVKIKLSKGKHRHIAYRKDREWKKRRRRGGRITSEKCYQH